MKYHVVYTVDGFPGVQKAGPYTSDEVEYQRKDIAGFEGVRDVQVVDAEEEDETK